MTLLLPVSRQCIKSNFAFLKHPISWCLLLYLVANFDTGESVLCYSCSYTYTSQHLGYECVNSTEEVKTSNIVSCSGEFCRDVVVYKKHEGNEFVVSSLSRSCMQQQHQGPNCTESLYERTCYYICEGTKCNNQDLSYQKPIPNKAAFTSTHKTTFALWSWAYILFIWTF